MFAFNLDYVDDGDIVMTTDADAFPMEPDILNVRSGVMTLS